MTVQKLKSTHPGLSCLLLVPLQLPCFFLALHPLPLLLQHSLDEQCYIESRF